MEQVIMGLGVGLVFIGLIILVIYGSDFQTLLKEKNKLSRELITVVKELSDRLQYMNVPINETNKRRFDGIENHLNVLQKSFEDTNYGVRRVKDQLEQLEVKLKNPPEKVYRSGRGVRTQ